MQFDNIDFLISLIKQCPENCVAEIQCNWTTTSYTDKEFEEIKGFSTISDCKSSRQIEVFKSSRFDKYKYKINKFGQFDIWEGGLNLFVSVESKNAIIEIFKSFFYDSDVCHFHVFTQVKQIVECYDSFMHNFLDSLYFKFTIDEKLNLANNDIDIFFK